jgi:hypothetical protein
MASYYGPNDAYDNGIMDAVNHRPSTSLEKWYSAGYRDGLTKNVRAKNPNPQPGHLGELFGSQQEQERRRLKLLRFGQR